jgi:hypothetical protein
MKYLTCFAVFVVLFFALAPASGQAGQPAAKPGPPDENQAPTVKLVLHPAAAPRPALKYQLLPPLVDRRPGNAAVLYNKVPAERTAFFNEFGKMWEKIQKWQETPLSDPRERELRKPWQSLMADGSLFQILDQAARCESCDWQLPIREQDFYSMLLPEFQQARNFARLLAAKARIEIAEKRFDAAERTLQSGYALSRHVAQGPCLVTSLVGLAIAGIISKDVEDWVQQPGAPNLYWALTWLPRPLIDLRPGVEGEMNAIYFFSCRDLRDVDTAKHSPEEWQRLLERTAEQVREWGVAIDSRVAKSQLTAAAAMRGYPMAKRALVAEDRPAAEVDAMPPAQVILIYIMHTYERLRDDVFKWFAVPYPEGRAGALEADRSLHDAIGQGREILPMAALLLPAIENARLSALRGDRTIAMLRAVEAIRLYGASHEGRLPGDLAEIKEVPAPADPITGKPFAYRLNGSTAILESPAIPGRSQKQFGVRYEIQFAKPGK